MTRPTPIFRIAVSSRALFNLQDGDKIFVEQGWAAFDAYMRKNEKRPLRPGPAFPLIQKLLQLNEFDKPPRVEVMLLSSNTLEAGARVMNSARSYGLNITKAFFTSGGPRIAIAKAANATMFLSSNEAEVREALKAGLAAARLIPRETSENTAPGVRIAFDGDAVLFSDESERHAMLHGLPAFWEHEQANAKTPLEAGPFKPVLEALHGLQKSLGFDSKLLRIALVTARSVPAYDRVLRTFRFWGLKVDECYFCDGLPKGPFLAAFNADLFFDDAPHNIESAAAHVPSGHVLEGPRNELVAA